MRIFKNLAYKFVVCHLHLNLPTLRQVAHKASTLSPTRSVDRCSGHLASAPPFSSFLILCCSPCCPRSTPPPAPYWSPRHCGPTVIVISFPHSVSSGILAKVFHSGHLSTSFVVCNLCQSTSSLTIFVSLWFIIISLVFFYLSKLLFSAAFL